MPELPEVQTVVNDIYPKIKGKKIGICSIYNNYSNVIAPLSLKKLSNLLKGQKIRDVRRRAKYILLELDSGTLSIHLRMTGRLQLNGRPNKYTTFSLLFTSGSLHLVDVRKFAKVEFFPDISILENRLGIEPLSRKFSYSYLQDVLTNSNRQIKPLLLDQSIIAGLGNIYVDEALWLAKIHPMTKANQIKAENIELLHQGIKKVLRHKV